MKKLFDKDEIWFAVVWIVVYVIGFANADSLSESIGIPKLLTVLFGFVLFKCLHPKAILFHFLFAYSFSCIAS